jgi:hypothetical protein
MASLIAALDSSTPRQRGENGHTEYGWSNDIKEEFVQLHFQLVRCSESQSLNLSNKLYEFLNKLKTHKHDYETKNLLSIMYCLIGQTRDVYKGKGEYALSYMMLYTWYRVFPELALFALETFVLEEDGKNETENKTVGLQYGSWKDIKYFADYCKKNWEAEDSPIIQKCVTLTNTQLRKDIENLKNGEHSKISLCAKWIPRESSQFSWFFKRLAQDFFDGPHSYFKTAYYNTPVDKDAIKRGEKKGYMEYRKIITSINKVLDTVQIKQCDGEWSKIDHNKTTSITLVRNKKAFLNVKKNDKQRSVLEDRIQCAANFKEYISGQIKSGKEIKGKRVGMEEFTVKALEIIYNAHYAVTNKQETTTEIETEMLNSQWRDSSSQTGALGKMIAMVDTSGSMSGSPLHVALALGIRVAEKSLIGKRVLTFSENPTWHNLEGCDGFVDMVGNLRNAEWGMNTNFFSAFELILSSLVQNKIPPEEIDGMILTIFSDMQIDCAQRGFGEHDYKSMYERMEEKFTKSGYKLPHIVFWNLRFTGGFPTLSTVYNCSMMSGYSPELLNLFCEKGVEGLDGATPYSILVESLSVERYSRLKQFFDSQM